MLVVHTHFHPRRTGVTSQVEVLVPALAPDARGLGELLGPTIPRTTFAEVWRRSATETVIWHAHRNNELLVGWLLRLLGRKLKLVFTRHDSKPPGWWTRFLFARADAVITLTPELAALARRPTDVVGNGVDLTRFSPPSDRAAAFSALGLTGKQGVGVIGRVRPEKGQGDFVEALRPLLSSRPDVTPVLIGLVKPEDQPFARALVDATHGRLQLVGEQPDVTRWYRGLSIVVQPSHREAFSMVLLEAMASGCCVIASRVGAAASVIEHGVTGLLFDAGDQPALRTLLEAALADPTLVERVGRAASQAVAARFSVSRQAEALRGVYERVSSGSGALTRAG